MPFPRAVAIGLVLTAAVAVTPAVASSPRPSLTGVGPATLRAFWNGPVTLEGRPPEVLVRWGLTVRASGGSAGLVRLRVLDGHPVSRVAGSSPFVHLPAAPGSYEWDLPVGIPYDPRQFGLAVEQDTGGHDLLAFSERPEDEVHTFTPPLSEDDLGRTPMVSRGRRLTITGVVEPDLDGDLVGDRTRDVGDLAALSGRVIGREPDGMWRIEARVRNVGTTVRHRPGIAIPDGAYGWRCPKPGDGQWRSCGGEPLAPGGEQTETLVLRTPDGAAPRSLTVAAEGPDLAPADNTIAVTTTPRMTLGRVAGGELPRVRLGVDRPGRVRLVAHVAGLRIVRTITFARADRRVVRLLPARRADRRRLARALRRPGRLTAAVSATLDGATVTLRPRL